jgi:acyl-CoA synthetase (NDP forming)
MHRHGKPVVVQSHYAHYRTPALDVLRRAGVPFCRHIEIAAQCLASAADYSEARRRMASPPAAAAAPLPAAAATVVASARAAGRTALLETEARDLLTACGVNLAPSFLLRDAGDAAAAIAALGDRPLALKVVSQDVLHKSDAGGVRLGVQGEAAVRAATAEIRAAVGHHVPGARVEGVLAAPMAARGIELIVGVSQDPQFGPVLLFGVGGIFVEAVRDVVFRALPVSRDDALEMIGDIRARKMLDGVRGLPAVDRDALAALLVKVAGIAAAGGAGIAEIDLNPVIATADGLVIADARMILA